MIVRWSIAAWRLLIALFFESVERGGGTHERYWRVGMACELRHPVSALQALGEISHQRAIASCQHVDVDSLDDLRDAAVEWAELCTRQRTLHLGVQSSWTDAELDGSQWSARRRSCGGQFVRGFEPPDSGMPRVLLTRRPTRVSLFSSPTGLSPLMSRTLTNSYQRPP
jgi:hypothetical protein